MAASRNTIQRTLVLQAVKALHNHPTADEIYHYVAKSYPTVSKGTVYRNLGLLADAGEIRRVSHLNAADRFDFNTTPHYHFRCRGCNRVFDVDFPHDNSLPAQVKNPKGFVIEECEITFSGLCADCAGKPDYWKAGTN